MYTEMVHCLNIKTTPYVYTYVLCITTQKMNVRTMYTVNGFQEKFSTLPPSPTRVRVRIPSLPA